jgi:hypothetical protein
MLPGATWSEEPPLEREISQLTHDINTNLK